MKLIILATTLLGSIVPLVSATAAWDSVYDSPSTSTLVLACSDGINGLYTKGYPNLGSIPGFPNVGAAPTIAGWGSPNCGKCFRITYAGTGNTIYITGVDTSRSSSDFVLSKAALNTLTNGLAEQLGRVPVDWEQVENRPGCGV